MWLTLLKLDNVDYLSGGENNEELYDYRFILRLLISLSEPGAEVGAFDSYQLSPKRNQISHIRDRDT
uniref:Uncharacterized protein n=1 Tax=Parascaris univalens TaxID=6257 RepID=A0A915A8D0_PARUN